MKANEFEQRFEEREDILDALDLSKARRDAPTYQSGRTIANAGGR